MAHVMLRTGSIAAHLEAKERADADARDVELRLCWVGGGGGTGNAVAQTKCERREGGDAERRGGRRVNRIADRRERRGGEEDHAGTSY